MKINYELLLVIKVRGSTYFYTTINLCQHVVLLGVDMWTSQLRRSSCYVLTVDKVLAKIIALIISDTFKHVGFQDYSVLRYDAV